MERKFVNVGDPAKKFNMRINFRVTEEQKKYIEQQAAERGMTVASYARAVTVDRIPNNALMDKFRDERMTDFD